MTYEEDREKIMHLLEAMSRDIREIHQEVDLLKFRSSMWGAISGVFTVVLYMLLEGCSPEPQYAVDPLDLQKATVLLTRDGSVICAGATVGSVVVTAAHCVSGGPVQVATMRDFENEVRHDAYVLEYHPYQDVAVLSVEGLEPLLRLTATRELPRIGSPLQICGHPHRVLWVCSSGVVTDPYEVTGDGMRYIRAVSWVRPGNSGGPVVNDRGELLGVTSFMLVGTHEAGFTSPLELPRWLNSSSR